ncbi:MAG: type II secretion system GspH family protein [Proteobacteria bacterium]|nr:type II secretion system GspH family protein [Pseudomonadota bacterium]
MKQHTGTKQTKGFTLIEMALILIVVGIVISIAVPRLRTSSRDLNTKKIKHDIHNVRDAIIGFSMNATNCSLPTDGDLDGAASSDLAQLQGENLDMWGESYYYKLAPVLRNASGSVLCDLDGTDVGFDVYEGSTLLAPNVAFFVSSSGPNHNREVIYDDTTTPVRITVQPYGTDVAGQEFDDIYSYAKWDAIKNSICTYCTSQAPDGTPQVDFSDMATDFATTGTVESKPNTIVVNAGTGEITLQETGAGSNAAGCQWYTGTEALGNCGDVNAGDGREDGVCDLSNGFRVHYQYRVPGTSAGGFSFALAGVDLTGGTNTDMTTMCGSALGASVGYSDQNGGNYIYPPKLGIEFDTTTHTARGDSKNAALANADANHMAVVYWGANGTRSDDNIHGASSDSATDINNPGPDPTPIIVDGSDGIFDEGTSKWLETGNTYDFRLEVERTGDEFKIRAWYDCSLSDSAFFDNLGGDLAALDAAAPAPDIELTKTHPRFDSDFDLFRFGWTMGTGSNNSTIAVISDFGFRWR